MSITEQDNQQDMRLENHEGRIRSLEEWRGEVKPKLEDLVLIQAKNVAQMKLVKNMFWALFALSALKFIAEKLL